MIIEKGTEMFIHNEDRGEFCAKARRSFSLDDGIYPVVITDPMKTSATKNQEADLRAAATNIEILEPETKTETEIHDTDESEIIIENTDSLDDNDCEDEEEQRGRIASFHFF